MLKKKNRGFTATELIVVIGVMAIMCTIAFPAFSSFIPNIRLRDAARDFYMDMQGAKMEAIKRNSNVVIQVNAVACPGLPASVPKPGGNYLVFLDDDNDGSLDAGEVTLANHILSRDVALCQETFGGQTGFLSTGLPLGGSTGKVVLNNNRSRSSEITLSFAGNITVK